MRAAIIGIGAIARLHAKALADIPGVTLVAATCRTEEKGRAFAGEFGCAWHADTATMLRREKPDGVRSPGNETSTRRAGHGASELISIAASSAV